MSKQESTKKSFARRSNLILLLVALIGLAVFFQAWRLNYVLGDRYREMAKKQTYKIRKVEAARGNIMAEDGSLLATSVPEFEVRVDLGVESISDSLFNSKVDSLAIGLADILGEYPEVEYKRLLLNWRREAKKAVSLRKQKIKPKGTPNYQLLKRKVDLAQLKKLKALPIFRLGKYKGGLIPIAGTRREMPFRELARRTIGYRKDTTYVGLEGAFQKELAGVGGLRKMQKIAGGVWRELSDEEDVPARNGNDIVTTLDINIQDVAESALMKALDTNKADAGCVILMEVQTGKIKAIANLGFDESTGLYTEKLNYAIGQRCYPGSTFKLASLMAAMEDGYITPSDKVYVGDGKFDYKGRHFEDSHTPKKAEYSIQEVFEESSNVGVIKTILRYYERNPKRFIDRLYGFHLNRPLGIEIPGEKAPVIKSPAVKTSNNALAWSGTSLAYISFGYELDINPLQILAFYNAIANDGKLVRPYLVSEIRHLDETVKRFDPYIIDEKICSDRTLRWARQLMEGVALRGTAKSLDSTEYSYAGKTGTAKFNTSEPWVRKMFTVEDPSSQPYVYVPSFVGYFPANQPKYSCMVVLYNPRKNQIYGGQVAAPVFREIASKIYASSVNYAFREDRRPNSPSQISFKAGRRSDISMVMERIGLPHTIKTEAEYVSAEVRDRNFEVIGKRTSGKTIPDLTGMNATDAVYIVESMRVKARIRGKGKVIRQSVMAGSPILGVKEIILELGI